MIESEETRKKLVTTVTRWTEYTKVIPYLRPGDVTTLVGLLLGDLYHVTLSCGHMVRSLEEGIALTFKDPSIEEEGLELVRVSGIYCKDCAEWYREHAGAWETEKGE